MTNYCWDVFSETFVFEILLKTKTFILKHVFWAHFLHCVSENHSVHPLCIYSKQTNIAAAGNIKYICLADDFSWKRPTRHQMIRKENTFNHCCVILRNDLQESWHLFTACENAVDALIFNLYLFIKSNAKPTNSMSK